MDEESLRDLVRNDDEAFNGLLSLIPAKMYYGEDTTDQWKKKNKKQSKQEKAAALKARLDPDNERNRSAKDVMDERARKNKRKLADMTTEDDEGDDDDGDDGQDEPDGDVDDSVVDGVEMEKPGQGMKKKEDKPAANKRQKTDASGAVNSERIEKRLAKKKAKQEARAAKQALKKERIKAKAAGQQGIAEATKDEGTETKNTIQEAAPTSSQPVDAKEFTAKAKPTKAIEAQIEMSSKKKSEKSDAIEEDEDDGWESDHDDDGPADADMNALDLENLDSKPDSDSASEPHSPIFDTEQTNPPAENGSTATSVSSVPSERAKIHVPADTTVLRARLQARIAELRAARKADGGAGGSDPQTARTRQDLIEQRRAKEKERKAHKKALRRQAKLDEERKREEQLALYSPMSPANELDDPTSFIVGKAAKKTPAKSKLKEQEADDPEDKAAEDGLAFGKVAFSDGTQLSRDLGHVVSKNKRKGPSDPKTALLKLQGQKKRLAGLDADKAAEVADKEAWLSARRRAEGDKIVDDEAALKKAIKRRENTKKRSERKWDDRVKGVEAAQKERQAKRTENIKKRKEDKILKKIGKKGGVKKKLGGGGGGKKGRPGFEGVGLGGGRKK